MTAELPSLWHVPDYLKNGGIWRAPAACCMGLAIDGLWSGVASAHPQGMPGCVGHAALFTGPVMSTEGAKS